VIAVLGLGLKQTDYAVGVGAILMRKTFDGVMKTLTCAKLCRKNGGNLEQIKLLLGHSSIQTTERFLGSDQEIAVAVNDNLGL
jgi:hypothetical protein